MSILEDLKLQYRIGGIANKMIYWNVGLFILSIPLFYQFASGFFDYPTWLAVSSQPMEALYKPWSLITYAFFHQGFMHLFFNMMVLHFSSRLLFSFFNKNQYLGFYLLCGVF